MNKLFVLSYSRILQRLGASEITAANARELLTKNSVAPTSEALLYRLPREELKHVLNIPCPINNLEQTNASEIIKSSKLLRNHVKYSQEKICAKCPHVEKCPSSKKPWAGEKYDDTAKDLLLYFSALHNYLQPDGIYYRQWVSAYRLGDSIIACIDDLAQGGKQIEEYQRIRQEGIKQLEAKGFQTTNEAKEAAKAKKLEEQLSRTPKTNKNQTKKDSAATAAGDFSFDEEPVFQPTQRSAKSSAGEQKPKRQPLKNYKGYQKIEQTEENEANQNKGQSSFKNNKTSNFNKEEPYKRRETGEGEREFNKPRRQDYNREDRNPSRPPYQKDYNREDRNGNRPQYQKDYNREDRNSYRPKYDNYNKGERSFNNEPKQYNSNPRDRDSARSYSQPNKYVKRESTYDNDSSENYPRRNKSNFNRDQKSQQQSGRDDRRGGRPEQTAYGNNNKFEQREYKNERTSFKNNNNLEQDDDSPKIRQFGNKSKGYEGQPPKKAVKANPFIQKWNEDPFQDNASKSRSASSQLKQTLNRASPRSEPKIIQMQAIPESGQRTGRNVLRRRRTTSQQTPDEQK